MTGKKIFVISITVITFVIASTLAYSKLNNSSQLTYKTSIIDRGDIISYVSSSGTLNPIQSVRVLAQVSGIIKEISVDFNSPVSQGQALAQIDTTIYETQVKQAKTALQKAQVEANQKGRLLKLYQELANEPDRISKYELANAEVEYTSALANLGKANSDLKLAEANLQSATIRSPINGVIISKNANVGEPVMPGQDYPLFVVASDLTRMELVANVSEADIGRIKTGNTASFTVDAYPDENFDAEVFQIRNSPVTRQNVVTYEIVLPVNNSELKLKPGMTAYIKVIVEKKQNVVRVPNIALKFSPPPDLIPEISGSLTVRKHDPAIVWVLSDDEKPKPRQVNVGMHDNNFTEISGGQLNEGDRVIAGVIQKKDPILASIISPQMNY